MRLFSRFKRRRDDEPVDPDERSPQLGLRYRDLMLLNEIAKRATDLSQPRHVLFFLYAPTSEAGLAIGEQARAKGFETRVEEPREEAAGQWPVTCETHAVLTPDFVRESVDFFEGLASAHRAEYDGWETAL
jgi:hypothetical protein